MRSPTTFSARPLPPNGADSPIDAFVRAKLTEHHLAASSEADRRTLCRRLYFDLTGLPPTPEEIAAWRDVPNAFIRSVLREGRTLYNRSPRRSVRSEFSPDRRQADEACRLAAEVVGIAGAIMTTD